MLTRESVHYLVAASKKAGNTVSSGPAPFLDPLSMMAAEEEAADEVDQENTDDPAAKGGLEGKKAEERMKGYSEAEERWREIKAEMAAAGAAGNNTAMIRIREGRQLLEHSTSLEYICHSLPCKLQHSLGRHTITSRSRVRITRRFRVLKEKPLIRARVF